jgi:hypothetical protein
VTTIYVDDMHMAAKVGRLNRRWSHLIPDPSGGPEDDLADLHALAARIGLKRAWFQSAPRYPTIFWPRCHYDVTDAVRLKAIAAGAVPVTMRKVGEMNHAAATTSSVSPAWNAAAPAAAPHS